MNERIKLLAEQAKGFVDLDQHVGGEKGCMVYTYDGLEKFAELIVKETLQVARAGLEYGPSIEEAVYTYFGVEE